MFASLNIKNRLLLACAVGTACLLNSTTASLAASPATSTFTAQITIGAACTVNSPSTLNFGNQGVLTGNVDQASQIQVQCTHTTPYNVGLDAGLNSGGNVTNRKMISGGSTVNYSIYSDSGRTTNWGNTVGTDTVAGTGNGSSQTIPVYGRVPAQTTPAPGSYTDTITVSVTY